jgi:nucleoside phosphorylase
MNAILDLTLSGNNLPPGPIEEEHVIQIARQLEDRLIDQGRSWRDVSLLLLLNSKQVVDDPGEDGDSLGEAEIDEDVITALQQESDEKLVAGLRAFCAERGHFPPLIGTTVHACFYADRGHEEADITDGLLLGAYSSAVLDAIPVAVEISTRRNDRKYAGINAVQKCVKSYRDQIAATYGKAPIPAEVFRETTGILFTSGSGHIGAKQFIDFTDCYAVGQELRNDANGAQIVGGCSSNRHEKQLQCIYYAKLDRGSEVYDFTYDHAAIATFLPYSPSEYLLQHPYELADRVPLQLEFNEKDQYDEGRYFYIERINGLEPMDFLVDYWDVSRDDMVAMMEKGTPIPAQMKTFEYTIASALSPFERAIWPNVPIWFDEVDGKALLRLVRAEAQGSPYYLMQMKRDGLRENVQTLAAHFDRNIGQDSAVVCFLCESRKYLLDAIDSNMEADTALAAMPEAEVKLGIYLNGEYAVGVTDSIGYHNFTQIATITPSREIADLPAGLGDAIKERRRKERVAVVLSAISPEQEAMLRLLDGADEEVHRGTVYTSGRYESPTSDWTVHTVLIGAGGDRAALEAERAIAHFEPEVVLFVGVAGGIKDVSLGDVVVATDIYGYEAGKASDSFIARPRVGRSNYSLVQRAERERQSDTWFESDGAPAVVVAPIAAGAKVVSSTRSPTYRFIRANYDQAVAVEMEGGGFLEAAHANQEVKALVIRGISDLLDDKEKTDRDGWQFRAADHAARFAMQILKKI